MILLAFIIAGSFGLTAQIKKRDLGRYTGTIESYKINSGQELLTVQSSPISIALKKEIVVLKIGSQEFSASYEIKKLERRSYIITFGTPFSDLNESLRLNGKKKEMLRKGLFPQPDCVLKKEL